MVGEMKILRDREITVPDIRISDQSAKQLLNALTTTPYRAKLFTRVLEHVALGGPPTLRVLRPLLGPIEEKIAKPLALAEMYFKLDKDSRDWGGGMTLTPNICKSLPTWVVTMLGLEYPENAMGNNLGDWILPLLDDIAMRTSENMATNLAEVALTDSTTPMAHMMAMLFLEEFLVCPVYMAQKQACKVLGSLQCLDIEPRTLYMFYR